MPGIQKTRKAVPVAEIQAGVCVGGAFQMLVVGQGGIPYSN